MVQTEEKHCQFETDHLTFGSRATPVACEEELSY